MVNPTATPGPATAAEDSRYSVVVTSCGRFDLLRHTLESLLPLLDPPPEEILVIEDSGDASVREALAGLKSPVRVMVNDRQLGQMASIDLAYGQVRTPFVFHCEDDWEFFRTGFIAESFALLHARPDISMVGLRPRHELNPLVRATPEEALEGVRFFALDPQKHPEYFSYSFNPGLRRMADYHAIGPFAPLGHEGDVSYAFKLAGFRIANLEEPAVRHIGDGRHVEDPTLPPKARTFLARLNRSIQKRLKRIRRRLGE